MEQKVLDDSEPRLIDILTSDDTDEDDVRPGGSSNSAAATSGSRRGRNPRRNYEYLPRSGSLPPYMRPAREDGTIEEPLVDLGLMSVDTDQDFSPAEDTPRRPGRFWCPTGGLVSGAFGADNTRYCMPNSSFHAQPSQVAYSGLTQLQARRPMPRARSHNPRNSGSRNQGLGQRASMGQSHRSSGTSGGSGQNRTSTNWRSSTGTATTGATDLSRRLIRQSNDRVRSLARSHVTQQGHHSFVNSGMPFFGNAPQNMTYASQAYSLAVPHVPPMPTMPLLPNPLTVNLECGPRLPPAVLGAQTLQHGEAGVDYMSILRQHNELARFSAPPQQIMPFSAPGGQYGQFVPPVVPPMACYHQGMANYVTTFGVPMNPGMPGMYGAHQWAYQQSQVVHGLGVHMETYQAPAAPMTGCHARYMRRAGRQSQTLRNIHGAQHQLHILRSHLAQINMDDTTTSD